MFEIKQKEILSQIRDNPPDDIQNLKPHFESSDKFLIMTASIQLQTYFKTKGLSDITEWTDVVISTLERMLIKQAFECLLSLPALTP